MSAQTDLARGEALTRKAQWELHYRDCGRCGIGDHRERCQFGEILYGALALARDRLRTELQIDQAQIPGQGELF